jgi:hypothetical protein
MRVDVENMKPLFHITSKVKVKTYAYKEQKPIEDYSKFSPEHELKL